MNLPLAELPKFKLFYLTIQRLEATESKTVRLTGLLFGKVTYAWEFGHRPAISLYHHEYQNSKCDNTNSPNQYLKDHAHSKTSSAGTICCHCGTYSEKPNDKANEHVQNDQ